MHNITLILSSVLLNCTAQLAMKKGMMSIGVVTGGLQGLLIALPEMVCNLFLWCSMVCYGISILLWMLVLSKVDVSFAYPFLSIGYVVSLVVGYCFFGENVTLTRVIGVIVICVGVVLVSRS